MAIPVTCPSCFTRFNVSEKFAGKSGPCPKCRKTIKIPEKSEEVVIHAPDDGSPKDSTGKSILNPVRRKEVKVSMPIVLAASLSSIVVMGVALGLRLEGSPPASWLLAISSLLLAVPIVILGYWFLQDDELEPFRGKPLMIRVGVCALIFALAWGVYAWVPQYVSGYESMAEISVLEMAILIPIIMAIGAAAAVLALELEVSQGVMLYMLYFALTFGLAWLAGSPLGSALPGNAKVNPPARVAPSGNDPAATPATVAPAKPPAEPEKKIPNLLQ